MTPQLTKYEILSVYRLPFSIRSLISMRCKIAGSRAERVEIIRAAITARMHKR